jgi:hypothetical protein
MTTNTQGWVKPNRSSTPIDETLNVLSSTRTTPPPFLEFGAAYGIIYMGYFVLSIIYNSREDSCKVGYMLRCCEAEKQNGI